MKKLKLRLGSRSLFNEVLKDGFISRREASRFKRVRFTPAETILFEEARVNKVEPTAYRQIKNLRDPSGYAGSLFDEPVSTGVLEFGQGWQGFAGTCVPLAVGPGNALHWDNGDGTSTWKFYDPITLLPEFVTVTNKIGLDGADYELGVFEKAWAKYLQLNGQVQPGKNAWQQASEGTTFWLGIRAITGRDCVEVRKPLDFSFMTSLVSQGKTVMLADMNKDYKDGDPVPLHAYRVVGASNGSITLYNPWNLASAVDGSVNGYMTRFVDELNSLSNSWLLAYNA